jgi:hypothetical protein
MSHLFAPAGSPVLLLTDPVFYPATGSLFLFCIDRSMYSIAVPCQNAGSICSGRFLLHRNRNKSQCFKTEVTEIFVQFFIELNRMWIVAYDNGIKENITFINAFFTR